MDRTRTATARPRSSAPAGLELVIVDEGRVRIVPLPARGEIVVGRAADCDVQIDHPEISRRHLQLSIGARVSVKDLGSHNGCELGGKRLVRGRKKALQPLDVLQVGALSLLLRPAATALSVGEPIVIDPAGLALRRGGDEVSLARRPVLRKLLSALHAAAGAIVDKEALVRAVWGFEYHPLKHDNLLRVHVHHLRALLDAVGARIDYDADGGGYRLDVSG